MAFTRDQLITYVGFVIIAVYFGGLAWGELAYRYFRYRCDNEAGEFIHRTVDQVEGVYEMRPRESGDYFDRIRAGDIPPDPFGHTNVDGQRPWSPFVGGASRKQPYHYFETTKPPSENGYLDKGLHYEKEPEDTGKKYWVYRRAHKSPDDTSRSNLVVERAAEIRSRYGYTWRELRSRWDRVFGVWGGELIVLDLRTDAEIAVRRGFILWATLSDRGGLCPRDKSAYSTAIFVRKVLNPAPM